jgi:hypothetical protein
MKKQRTGHRVSAPKLDPKPGAVGSKKRPFPTAILVGALTLACAVVLAIWLAPVPKSAPGGAAQNAAQADASGWKVGMLRPDGLRITVTGNDDASKVLDAEQFSRSEVRNGYRIAKQIPAVLNKLYCWCGCENRGDHRSNLQCFEDGMAEDCEVCLGTAEIAYDMTHKGITDAAQIQAAVDVHWGPNR